MTLDVKDLACVRGGRPVFAELSFQAAPGDLVVVRGPNGCGKSSLLRLIAGFLRPAAGTIMWDQTAITEDRPAHGARTSYLGHLDAVKPVLTVEENLDFWAGLGNPSMAPADQIMAALKNLELRALADLPGGYLSAGQKRRLNLARLLVRPSSLWLLDEPTATLDDRSAAIVTGLISEHCAGGGVAIVATHLSLGLPAAVDLDMDQYRARAKLEVVP